MPSTGRTKKEQEVFDRYFNGMHVEDARWDIMVIPLQADIGSAVPGDPTKCVFAQACRRAYGSRAVIFFKTVAYVDLPDENGIMTVFRFLLSPRARKLIESFDTGELQDVASAAFKLKAPSPAYSLETRRKRDRNDYENGKRQAWRETAKAKRREASRQGIGHRRSTGENAIHLGLDGVRNGAGMVQYHLRNTQ